MYSALDDGFYGGCIFLDIAKAFDVLNHDILLSKMEKIGLPANIVGLFGSYLSDRSQYIDVGGVISSHCQTKTGVPQGSILGPTLFNIFVNDLPQHISGCCQIAMFSDDVALFHKSKSLFQLHDELNKVLIGISGWYNSNHLAINVDKSNYIIFASRLLTAKTDDCITNNNLRLTINNNALDRVEGTKYLGLYITSSLSWDKHINSVANKINIQIGMMHKLKGFAHQKILMTFYYANIHSHLIYALPVWGAYYANSVNVLIIAQKKAIRIIAKADFLAPSKPIFSGLRLLNFNQLWMQTTVSFVYKILNNIYIQNVNIGFQRNSNCGGGKDDYVIMTRTRNIGALYYNSPRTNAGKFALRYCGSWAWNQISSSIRENKNISKFRFLLKDSVLMSNFKSLI